MSLGLINLDVFNQIAGLHYVSYWCLLTQVFFNCCDMFFTFMFMFNESIVVLLSSGVALPPRVLLLHRFGLSSSSGNNKNKRNKKTKEERDEIDKKRARENNYKIIVLVLMLAFFVSVYYTWEPDFDPDFADEFVDRSDYPEADNYADNRQVYEWEWLRKFKQFVQVETEDYDSDVDPDVVSLAEQDKEITDYLYKQEENEYLLHYDIKKNPWQ